MLNSLILGFYLSFVYTCTETAISVIIIHGFLNFMGTPNIEELITADYSD